MQATITRANGAPAADIGRASSYALIAIATLAGGAALYTGATYGYDRAGVLGSAVGISSALGCLLAPKILLEAIRHRNVAHALAAAAMIAVSTPLAGFGGAGGGWRGA